MKLCSPQATRNRPTRAAGLFLGLGLFFWISLPGAASAQTGGGELPGAAPEETFREEILPVFKEHCLRCHGEELMVKELDLSRLSSLLKGSESGPVVVPGRPAESKLYRLIESGSMPPDREGGFRRRKGQPSRPGSKPAWRAGRTKPPQPGLSISTT